jgi:hypothetical protein
MNTAASATRAGTCSPIASASSPLAVTMLVAAARLPATAVVKPSPWWRSHCPAVDVTTTATSAITSPADHAGVPSSTLGASSTLPIPMK